MSFIDLIQNPTSLLNIDSVSRVIATAGSQWGIYDQYGIPVIASGVVSNLAINRLGVGQVLGAISSLLTGGREEGINVAKFSVVDFAYRKNWKNADYPIEKGQFVSYDKVVLPFDVRVRIAAGGSPYNRMTLLDRLEALDNTELFNVLTPEKVYFRCSVANIDYQRTATNGVGIIVADIWMNEIRQTATTIFSGIGAPTSLSPPVLFNTQTPGSASANGLGNLQPSTPSSSVDALFGGLY
jgi:hypothetical protein